MRARALALHSACCGILRSLSIYFPMTAPPPTPPAVTILGDAVLDTQETFLVLKSILACSLIFKLPNVTNCSDWHFAMYAYEYGLRHRLSPLHLAVTSKTNKNSKFTKFCHLWIFSGLWYYCAHFSSFMTCFGYTLQGSRLDVPKIVHAGKVGKHLI